MSLFVHTGQGPSPSAWAREGAILQMLPRGLCFNEAQAFQPGKLIQVMSHRRKQVVGFNEAQAFQPGKLPWPPSWWCVRAPGFNEAQAFQPGKQASKSHPGYHDQWLQ